uniref:Uncharacterized protein n=1 Tax=Anguilla anguilla TaxID=7936 RepID=A0A0E9XSV5_ANGAN
MSLASELRKCVWTEEKLRESQLHQ